MRHESRVTAIVEGGCRALVRLTPTKYREALGEEALATIRAVCLAAHRRRGLRGLMREGLLEWLDLGRLVVRARLGHAIQTTGGPSPARPPKPQRGSAMRWLIHDLKLALRSLAASRPNTAIAMLTLALGIGINSAVFSILDSVLLEPVPFRDAHQLVELWNFNAERKFSYSGTSPEMIVSWRGQTDLFQRVEGYDRASLVYRSARGSEMVPGAIVTPGLLPMLGVMPASGRTFVDGDGRDSTAHLAVISDQFWRAQLQQDPGAVGRTITLDNEAYTVVGIMPASFRGSSGPTPAPCETTAQTRLDRLTTDSSFY